MRVAVKNKKIHYSNEKGSRAASRTRKTTESRNEEPNKPRNLLVTDATHTFTFSFLGRFSKHQQLTVFQRPDEDTWPGGALWDLGVLMACVIVGISGGTSITTTMIGSDRKTKSKVYPICLPDRIKSCVDWKTWLSEPRIILELGCGVGLTGLVAAASIGANLTVLTDLNVVVEKVTTLNVMNNTIASPGTPRTRTINKGKVITVPLCWGNEEDEGGVSALMESWSGNVRHSHRKAKDSLVTDLTKPDLVLIGDVAYQHGPGAPCHFEALVSTLRKFVGPQTLVIFGTRIRMPASHDLLYMMQQHLDEIVSPLKADEIEPSFSQLKHNMSIHFLGPKLHATLE